MIAVDGVVMARLLLSMVGQLHLLSPSKLMEEYIQGSTRNLTDIPLDRVEEFTERWQSKQTSFLKRIPSIY